VKVILNKILLSTGGGIQGAESVRDKRSIPAIMGDI
jgi:hypothetical protein